METDTIRRIPLSWLNGWVWPFLWVLLIPVRDRTLACANCSTSKTIA